MPLDLYNVAVPYEDNVCSLIEQRLSKRPFGEFKVNSTELEDKGEVASASRTLCNSERYSAVSLFESAFGTVALQNKFPLNSPADRLSALTTLARAVNSADYITAGQLFAFSVNHPTRGVYAEGNAVARQDRVKSQALFTTVLEEFPEYAKSYATHTLQAYTELNQKKAFTPEHPFTVFIIGDANMRITKEVERIFREKKGTIPLDHVKLVVVDNAPGVLKKLAQVQHKNGPRLSSENCDARQIGTLLGRFSGERGVLLTEELLDAFPCEVLQVEGAELFQVCFSLEDSKSPKQVLIPLQKNSSLLKQWNMWCELFPEYKQMALDLGKHKYPNNRIFMNIGMLQMMQGIMDSGFKGKWIGGDYMSLFLERRQQQYIQSGGVRLITNDPQDGLPGVNNNLLLATVQRSDMTIDVDYGLFGLMGRLGAKIDFLKTYHEFVAAALNRKLLSAREVNEKAIELRDKIKRERVPSKVAILYRDLGAIEQHYTGVRGTWQIEF